MYHSAVHALDQAAAIFHGLSMLREKIEAHRLAGILQQRLLEQSPYPRSRRFLAPQWAWATGHLGLTYQIIRWFRHTEPETKLVLTTNRAANPHFLAKLAPFLTIWPDLPPSFADEAMHNAVFFGCPDGSHNLVEFNKLIERECHNLHLLTIDAAEQQEAHGYLRTLGLTPGEPFVALQARKMTDDPARNVGLKEIRAALADYSGIPVVSTGLDPHPINETTPHVLSLPDPMRASFLLNATCDQFVGSNSGAWTIAHAFQRPVKLINDHLRSAWIYA